MTPLKLLAISGSIRAASTNSALLEALRDAAPPGIEITLYQGLGALPVFSPDLEDEFPDAVREFEAVIRGADGVIIASPEYVRSIPGGLKNAIDWLVSGDVLITKPICLAHASHRGDDMLATLRAVLGTVSMRFAEDIFLRVPVMTMTPADIRRRASEPETAARLHAFVAAFAAFCRAE